MQWLTTEPTRPLRPEVKLALPRPEGEAALGDFHHAHFRDAAPIRTAGPRIAAASDRLPMRAA